MSKPNPFDDLDQMYGSETASTSPGGTAVDEGSVNHFELARTFPHIDDAYTQHIGESEPEVEQAKTEDAGYGAHGIMVGGKAWRPNMSDMERADYFRPKSVAEADEQTTVLNSYRAMRTLFPEVSPHVPMATNVNTRAALTQVAEAQSDDERDTALGAAAANARSIFDAQVVMSAIDRFPVKSPMEMRRAYLANPRMPEQVRRVFEDAFLPLERKELQGRMLTIGADFANFRDNLDREERRQASQDFILSQRQI